MCQASRQCASSIYRGFLHGPCTCAERNSTEAHGDDPLGRPFLIRASTLQSQNTRSMGAAFICLTKIIIEDHSFSALLSLFLYSSRNPSTLTHPLILLCIDVAAQ